MRSLLILLMCMAPCISFAERIAPSRVVDPELEQKVDDLSSELRCLVCDDKTIANSNNLIAKDLRNKIRELLLEGKTSEEVKDYMKENYGSFIKYKSLIDIKVLLLSLGPLLLLAIAVYVIIRSFQDRKLRHAEEHSISDVDSAHIEKLVDSDDLRDR